MAYEPYASPAHYWESYGGTAIPEDKLPHALITASRHVDSLTFNRILGIGWDKLTEFQQEVIREVVCQQADFEYENADAISSALQGYSINGVSVQFGPGWNVFTGKGVAMKRDVYTLLEQTGLCCRLAR